MKEYPKTKNLFQRDLESKKLIAGIYQIPELESVNLWRVTEKLDGMSVRIHFDQEDRTFTYAGRTKRSVLTDEQNETLLTVGRDMFENIDEFVEFVIPKAKTVTFYGELIGPKVQGNPYGLDGLEVHFFDALVDDSWWLEQSELHTFAHLLGIQVAPVVAYGVSLQQCIEGVVDGFRSHLDVFVEAEGVVILPCTGNLFTQRGERIKAKIKRRDFPSKDWAA